MLPLELNLNPLHVSAYTAMVIVVIYLISYSYMFDWWKSSLGRAMNVSLIFSGIAAVGIVLRFYNPAVGMVVSTIGWIGFSIAVLWRLRLLTIAYHQLRKPLTQEDLAVLRDTTRNVKSDPYYFKETQDTNGNTTEKNRKNKLG